MPFFQFLRANAPFLAVGALLSGLSGFGQTFFISVFGGEIRETFGLSNGEWGQIYMFGTGASAVAMLLAGGLADRFRVRALAPVVVLCLALSCLAMALNTAAWALPLVVFALRFFGQGMASHMAVVAMARWFVATRGRALAVASMGFMLCEALLPLTAVWLKGLVDWHLIWIGAAAVSVALVPVLHRLLKLERTPASHAAADEAAGLDNRHWTRAEVLRHPLFWAFVPSLFLFPAFGTAFWFHQVHFAEVKGWSHLALVAVFPLGTITFAASTMLYGWAIDRFGTGRLVPVYLVPVALGFLLHWHAPSIGWTAAGVVMMGLAGGGQATLPNAFWAEYFGTRHTGSVKSAVAAVMVLGSAAGPGISGWLIDAGITFPDQLLGYSGLFVLAGLVTVVPLARARPRLPAAR